jgi:outer membrane protein assembly factor BamB
MKHSRSTGRWLALGITLAVFGVVTTIVGCPAQTRRPAAKLTAAPQVSVGAEAAPSGGSHDMPLFGGSPGRNMVNTVDKNIPGDWIVEKKDRDGKVLEKGKNIKWVADLGSRAYGGPVVSGGKIFVGTNNHAPRDPKITGDKGVIMCFNEADGKFLWQIVHDKLPSGQVHDWPNEGICSTPLVDGDHVYYVSNRCTVVCANTADGKKVWELDMMKDLNVFPHNMSAGSALMAGDTLFVVTANGVDEGHVNIPSPEAPSFIALDKKTGKVKWKDSSPGKSIMHGQWSNPSYGVINGKPQVIFPGGDGWLYSFEPETGKLIWKFDANPKDSKYELGGRGTKSDFIATPVIIGDKVIIGTGQDPEHYEGIGHLWCIEATKTGDVSPELVEDAKANPIKTKPNPNSAVVWHYGGPTTMADRDKLQRDYYFGRTMSTVSVHDGLVYAGELAGYVHCLDLKTGKPYWVHDLKAAVWGSTYWVDNKVMIATEEGDVWVFPHGKGKDGKTEAKKIEIGQPVRSTPIAVNGVLYVMSESHLYAIAGK